MKHMLFVLIVSLALAGCVPAGAPPAGQAAPTNTPAPQQGAPTSAPTVVPSSTPQSAPAADKLAGASVVYERSGGIAGRADKWTLYPDGRVVNAQGAEQRVDAASVVALMTLIEQAKFFDLPDLSSRAPASCRDCFKYTISVSMGGKTKMMTTYDGMSDVPAAFNQVLEAIVKTIGPLAAPGK